MICIEPEFCVSYEDLKQLIEAKEVRIFDVREPEELIEHGRIEGSTNIPVGDVEKAFNLSEEEFEQKYNCSKPLFTDKDIVFHCMSGRRSSLALHKLHNIGFKSFRHLGEGWKGWAEKEKIYPQNQ